MIEAWRPGYGQKVGAAVSVSILASLTGMHFWYNLYVYLPHYAVIALVTYALRLLILGYLATRKAMSESFWATLGTYVTMSALSALLLGGNRSKPGMEVWEFPTPPLLSLGYYPDDRSGMVAYHAKHDLAALIAVLLSASVPGWLRDRKREAL